MRGFDSVWPNPHSGKAKYWFLIEWWLTVEGFVLVDNHGFTRKPGIPHVNSIVFLWGFETAPGSDDEETEADVEATKQGDVVAQPLESVQEKRRCPNRGDSDTPRVEVEDDELEDEEDDDGKTLVSDTNGTESEIS
ncbi:hypothetical protein U1Q18_020337 [Sarracenia purpurea var. burkii]